MTALALSNEATFTEAGMDAYRRAREEYEQMQVALTDAEERGERRGEARGEARRELRAKRTTLRSLYDVLGVPWTPVIEARVDACADAAVLEAWIVAVATTRSLLR